jgi:arthrofactin-type cyclic lipopeptide synthetase C
LQCFEPINISGQALVPFGTVDELCEAYLQALKEIQPAGHYRLIGHSHGGLIALKLASLLKEQGHIVESLGLIDTVADVGENILAQVKVHRNTQALDADYMHFIFSDFKYYLQCDLQVDLPLLKAMTDDQRLVYVAQELAYHNIIHSVDVEFVRNYLFSRKQHENTLTDYFFEKTFPVFDGNVCLFKASGSANDANEFADDYGWNEFLQGDFQTVSVAGSHESLIIAPQVNSLGAALRQFVESV